MPLCGLLQVPLYLRVFMTKKSLLVFLLLFASWELAFMLMPHLIFVIASPSKILMRIASDWKSLLFHTGVTASEMVKGFAIALLFAFPMAILMDAFRSLRGILQPLFVTIQCVPLFALAPIMVILFDWSDWAIVVTTALMIFFPLTMALYQGLLSTPVALLDYFKLHQAPRLDTYLKLKLPWATPHFFSGLKISAGIAGIGTVGGEWAGGQNGLGLLMLESRRGGDFEQSFAALFCLIFITLSFYGFIAMLEMGIFKKLLKRTEVAGLMTALLLLTGCSSSTETKERKLLLDWLPNPNHVPLYVGLEKGFFKNNGIPLQIRKVTDPTDILPYISSGQVDFVVFYVPDSISAVEANLAKPIATYINEPLLSFMCQKEANIKNVADLNGKKIGYCVSGFGQRFLQKILKENGVGMAELMDVHYALVPAIGTKKVDALFGGYYNIEGEYLKTLGVELTTLPQASFGIPDHPELIILSKMDFDEKEAEQFRKGLSESIQYAKAHPVEAFNIYLRYNPDKGEKTVAWEKNSWEITRPLFADDTRIDWDKWNVFKNWLKEKELL